MNILDIAASIFPPKIDCPGMTSEQKKAFLRSNHIFGGRITLEHPSQLDDIKGKLMIGGEITSRKGKHEIKGNISIGKNSITIK